MTTDTEFRPGDLVRPTAPVLAPDHEGVAVWWKPTWTLRVLSQVGDEVKVVNDATGRRCVLPADQLTRCGSNTGRAGDMTDDELRAAERVRRLKAGEHPSAVYGADDAVTEGWHDRKVLSEAWLAEHPADDGEPVTADWYASAGGRTADDGTLSIALPGGEVSMVFYPFGVTTATPQVWLWTRCGALLDVGNTRGHVRRLCAALGIPLTESN